MARYQTFKSWLLITAVLSGLTLVPLMPVLLLIGTGSGVFSALFLVHLVVHGVALSAALWYLIKLGRDTAWGLPYYLLLALPFIATTVLGGLLPVTNPEALSWHLAIPNWWIKAGKMIELPWHEHSYYPALIHTAFAAFFDFGLEHLISLYLFSYGVILSAIIGSLVHYKTRERDSGALAALIVITIPVATQLMQTPGVIIPSTLFFTIFFSALIYWFEQPASSGYLVLSGAALGLALSSQSELLPVAFFAFAVLVLFFGYFKYSLFQSFKAVFIAGGMAFLIFLPWIVRNALWVSNPFFPYLREFLGPPLLAAIKGAPAPIDLRQILYGENWADLVLVPFRLMVSGVEGDTRNFDGALTPILLLAPLAIVLSWQKRWILFALLLGFGGLSVSMFIVPISASVAYLFVAPLLVAALSGYSWLGQRLLRYRPIVVLLVTSIHLLFAGYLLANSTGFRALAQYAESDQSNSVLESNPERAIIDLVNSLVKPEETVYLAQTRNQFALLTPHIRADYAGRSELFGLLRSVGSPSEILRELHNRGIGYLWINRAGWEHLLMRDGDAQLRARWAEVVTQLEAIGDTGSELLYKVKPL